MTEQWKLVPGYGDVYEVSDRGRVRSYSNYGAGRTKKLHPKILSQHTNSNGYMRVRLSSGVKGQSAKLVHRLVMLAFVGDSDLEVNHKNANRTDNRLENLEYLTVKENRNYAYRVLGKRKAGNVRGESSGGAKLNESDIHSIRYEYKCGATVEYLAKKYMVARSTCVRAINGKTWGHIEGALIVYNPRNANKKKSRWNHYNKPTKED